MFRNCTIFILLSCLLFTSCQEKDKIRVLEVDTGVDHKKAVKEEKAMPSLAENVNLIMGIVIPTSNRQWFIKMAGPYEEFENKDVTPMFDKLRETIRFDDYSVEVVTFELAEGWVFKREKGFIHSSITHPKYSSKFTISSARGSLLDNVNRWYGQLGMQPITDFGLTQVVQKINFNGYFALAIPVVKSRNATQSANPHGSNPHGNNPHNHAPEEKKLATAPSKGIRIAFGLADEQTWYIKMAGSSNTLIKEKANFEAFSKSFKFKDGKAEWTVPEGWEKRAGGSMSVGTFSVADAMVTVIPLAAQSGSLDMNVNRWRGQIGLASVPLAEIEKSLNKLSVGGNEFNYIFLSNTSSDSGGSKVSRDSGLDFNVPDGWKELPPSSMRRMNLEASGMAVTGIFLGKAAQGLKKNLDRWCGQIGLPNLSPEKMAEVVKSIPFNGSKADYAVLEGKEQSILVVLYDTSDGVWFFKVMGDTQKVMKEKASFEELVASVKIKEVK
ncbi:MAG: hypothetical protein NE328_20730 [Lentisphaeraceae bacterium]|nr:hypothetical protein [Lentisphaeraceae bacterium]